MGYDTLGTHLLVEIWGAKKLSDPTLIENLLKNATDACGATLLNIHIHHFGDDYGVTGVALLAESHISIHTWPEHEYAAFDIFVCGDAEPSRAIQVIEASLEPTSLQISEHKRGILRHPTAMAASVRPTTTPEVSVSSK